MAFRNDHSVQIVFRVRRSLLAVACLGLLVALTGTLTVASPVDDAIPIAKARSLPLGTKVTVYGVTSTPSGDFESSFDDKGFGLQDASGGIYVSTPDNANIAPPWRARVSGVLTDKSGLLTVVPADAAAIRKAATKNEGDFRVIAPKPLKTADVGEANEGLIVRVRGKVTQAPSGDGPYGYKVSINDGSGEALIFVNVQTNIPMSSFTAGQVVSVAGFSSQYDTHHEVDPRSPADIGAAKP
jgi:hypothetical protein